MKDKVLKIILIISSLPLIGIFLLAIYLAIDGNGFADFMFTIVGSFFAFVPVVQICLAYQLFYLIRYIVKNNKIDKALKIIFIISLILSVISFGPVSVICLAYQIFYITRHFIKKHKSKKVVTDGDSELQEKIK